MSLVEESKEISRWLCEKLNGIEIPNNNRTRVSAGCFDVSMEHQISVTILTENRLFGSAFALARCAFESYIRGAWFKYCASEQEIENFLKGKFEHTYQKLVDDIEACDKYSGNALSTIKNSGWKFLNDFTHTGSRQVIRRHTETYVESSYPEDEVIDMLDFVNVTSLLAGYDAFFLSKTVDESEAASFLNKIKEYKGRLRTIRSKRSKA